MVSKPSCIAIILSFNLLSEVVIKLVPVNVEVDSTEPVMLNSEPSNERLASACASLLFAVAVSTRLSALSRIVKLLLPAEADILENIAYPDLASGNLIIAVSTESNSISSVIIKLYAVSTISTFKGLVSKLCVIFHSD